MTEKRAALGVMKKEASVRDMKAEMPAVRRVHGLTTLGHGRYPAFHDHCDGLSEFVVEAFCDPLNKDGTYVRRCPQSMRNNKKVRPP